MEAESKSKEYEKTKLCQANVKIKIKIFIEKNKLKCSKSTADMAFDLSKKGFLFSFQNSHMHTYAHMEETNLKKAYFKNLLYALILNE